MSTVQGLNPPTPYTGTDTNQIEVNFLETYVDQLLSEVMPGGALAGSSPFMPGDTIGSGAGSYQGGGEVGQVLQLVQQLLQQIAMYQGQSGSSQAPWSPFSSQGAAPNQGAPIPSGGIGPSQVAAGPSQVAAGPSQVAAGVSQAPVGGSSVGAGGDIASSGPLKGLPYGAEIASAALAYGLDPMMLYGQAIVESEGPGSGLTINPNVAGGIFQGGGAPAGVPAPPLPNTGNAVLDQALQAAQQDSELIKAAGGNVKMGIDAYNSGNFQQEKNPAALFPNPSYYDYIETWAAQIAAFEGGSSA
jgi:hypothetical protein